jgi:hypothetical protein
MGWRVAGIDAQRLTLALGDRTVSIALFAQKPSAPLLSGGHDSSERHAPFAKHDD